MLVLQFDLEADTECRAWHILQGGSTTMCLKMCEASPCAWYSLTLSEPVQARQSENTSIPQGLRRLGLALIPAQHPSHLLGTTLISSADEPALQTLSNHILLKWHRLENFSHLTDQLNRQEIFLFYLSIPPPLQE